MNDDELRHIFVGELKQYATNLDEIVSGLKNDLVNIEDDEEFSKQAVSYSVSIEQIIHTLTGNFKNLDLGEIGDSIEVIEPFLKIENNERYENEIVIEQLGDLKSLLASTALEINESQGVSENTIQLYGALFRNFNIAQLEVIKNSIPFDDNSDTDEDKDSVSPDDDFAISHLANDTIDEKHYGASTSLSDGDGVEDGAGDSAQVIDDELRKIFLDENESLLNRINTHLSEWRQNDVNEDILGGIRREFHTLKGSAAATGYDDISRLSHVVESLLGKDVTTLTTDDSSLLNLMEEMHDGLAAELGFIPGASEDHIKSLISMVEILLSDDAEPYNPIVDDSIELSEELDEVLETTGEVVNFDASEQTTDSEPTIEPTESMRPGLETISEIIQSETIVDSGIGNLRIDSKKLTDMLNYSGELGLTRTQLKAALDGTRGGLETLRESMKLIRDGLRDLEFEADAQIKSLPDNPETGQVDESFDPLQLDRYSRLQARAREVNHQLDILSQVERQLGDRAADFSGALIQQSHLGEQLQEGLIRARMVSINEYLPRLRQLARETSRRTAKAVELTVTGGEIEVDRQVMDTMMPPFEHMIRNAIVHGIEGSEHRAEANKPSIGKIQVNVTQQGSELLIDFSDDGRGLDKQTLSQRALDLGLVENVDATTDDHFLQVITQPGYSTADEITLDSGRGVGMDVVYQAVRTLGGSMALISADVGTALQFRLPVTMTISQALLVKVGTYRFAILTRNIERVMRVHEDELESVDDKPMITIDDQQIPVTQISEQMDVASLSTDEGFKSLVLIRLADRLAAFEVDQFQETVEIVSKTPGTQLTSINGVIGVTVLADSSTVLILDPGQFVDRTLQTPVDISIEPEQISQRERIASDVDMSTMLHRVLVVDDSLVVRRIMQRDFEAIGLEVLSAVDGINALEILEESIVDMVLLDLEMPRMNGYELLVKLRDDERFQNLPIIIITSRSGGQHRDRAMSLGADEYITKPYDVEKLKGIMEVIAYNKTIKH